MSMSSDEFAHISRTGETFASHAAHHMYDPPADEPVERRTLTFSIAVEVPEGTDAGDVAMAMADQLDGISDSQPDWQFGAYVLEGSP